MIRVIVAFFLFLIAIVVGIQLSRDPGYVLITLNHWTVEITVWVALLFLILAFFLLHLLFNLISSIQTIPSWFKTKRSNRRNRRALETTRKGLIEFSEGYWASAKKHLIKALPDVDSPLLNYLTAARAAQELGENKLRDDFLREAQHSEPDAKIAVELTQAQLQLAKHQWEQALATLKHLHDLAPKHPYVLKLLAFLYQEVRDWPQLIQLLPALEKNHALNAQELVLLRHHVYLNAANDYARQGQGKDLDKLIQHLPKSLQTDEGIMAIYCQFLLLNQRADEAEGLLRRYLRKQFSEKLITLYGQYVNAKQLPFAEGLLKKNLNSAALLGCLGRLCCEEQLWGKAKTYLTQSIAIKPNREAYLALGQLYEHLNDTEQACIAYRKGLELESITSLV